MSTISKIISKTLGIDAIVQKQALLEAAKMVKKNSSLTWTPRTIYRTRADIKTWSEAEALAMASDIPRNYAIQLLYEEIRKDALLTSQIQNRKKQVFSVDFSLKKNGEKQDEPTRLLKKSKFYKQVTDAILETIYVGYNMVEFDIVNDTLTCKQLPRTNYTPINGRWYNDYMEDKSTDYRNLPEYGRWIMEFDSGEMGLLNKAIPHVLFKRFAQSCWSELCEIYGIPPRVMKTNTQDTNMLKRGEQMMQDMGAAAWFIIDSTEEFEFAKGADTNGDVYNSLITLCNNENSLLISGAIIGQDTVNGNRSKDESAQDMLWELVKSDMEMVEGYWNNTVIPGLEKIGGIPAGLTFEFEPAEDVSQLFKFTQGLLQAGKDVDNDWLIEKFGVQIIGNRQPILPDTDKEKLSAFFD